VPDGAGAPKRPRVLRRIAAASGAVLAVAILAALWGWDGYTGPGPLVETQTVVIPKGAGMVRIAELLAEHGVIRHPRLFVAGTRIAGLAHRLRRGEFAFTQHMSMIEAARHLAFGQPVMRRLTLVEGFTASQALALIAGAEGLDGPAPAAPAEGSLLPETYLYTWGDSQAEILARMHRAMDTLLDSLWPKRADGIAVSSPIEALILASIVEKETALPGERPMVSAVFQNRLRRGMRLQSDPTVVYALTDGKGALDRRLGHADLEQDSPYNTYKIAGLPPGPIGNPGRASIEAALHPAATDALYFVADGTGGHVFARTIEEHNRNVARLRAMQQQP